MARLFVRLKLSLIAGALHGPGGVSRIIGLILALAGAVVVMPAAFALLVQQHGTAGAANITGVVFAAFAVAWLVLPIAMFGADETLDPARLALLPLRPPELARGLLAAAVTGIGPLFTVSIVTGAAVAAASGLRSVPAVVAAVAIEVAMCVTGSRAVVTALSGILRSRRGRDLGVLLGGVLVLGIFAANQALDRSLAGPAARHPHSLGLALAGAARFARWTPPGMTAHAITDVSLGRYGLAALELSAGAATVAVAVLAWMAVLRRALERPDSSTHVSRPGRPDDPRAVLPVLARAGAAGEPAWLGAVYLARLRASRALGVAGRELRYFRRDPRRKQQLVSLVMPILLIVANSPAGIDIAGSSGVPARLPVWPAVLGGMIAGMFSSANQFGFDGSALWLNMSATARWQDLRADIAGKNLAGAAITVPIFAVLYLMLGIAAGDGESAAAAFAMSVCALGATSGVASISSVLLPIPIPERRSSAFSSGGTGQGCLAGLATIAGMAVTVVLMIPALVLAGRWHSSVWLLAAAPCYGILLAWTGRRFAAIAGFRRLPELFAEVSRLA